MHLNKARNCHEEENLQLFSCKCPVLRKRHELSAHEKLREHPNYFKERPFEKAGNSWQTSCSKFAETKDLIVYLVISKILVKIHQELICPCFKLRYFTLE